MLRVSQAKSPADAAFLGNPRSPSRSWPPISASAPPHVEASGTVSRHPGRGKAISGEGAARTLFMSESLDVSPARPRPRAPASGRPCARRSAARSRTSRKGRSAARSFCSRFRGPRDGPRIGLRDRRRFLSRARSRCDRGGGDHGVRHDDHLPSRSGFRCPRRRWWPPHRREEPEEAAVTARSDHRARRRRSTLSRPRRGIYAPAFASSSRVARTIAIVTGYARVMLAGTRPSSFSPHHAIFRGPGDASIAIAVSGSATDQHHSGPAADLRIGPFPNGVTGAAVGNNIGRGIAVLIQIATLARGRGRIVVRRRHLRLDPRYGQPAADLDHGDPSVLIGTASGSVWCGS